MREGWEGRRGDNGIMGAVARVEFLGKGGAAVEVTVMPTHNFTKALDHFLIITPSIGPG